MTKLFLLFCITASFAGIPQFQEDLSFGAAQDEDEFIWGKQHTYVSANDAGDIFVFDAGENRILKFDQEGQFLQQIGKKGQGPGEFENMSYGTVLADGRLFVMELPDNPNARIHLFDKNSKFEKTIPQKSPYIFLKVNAAPDGQHFAATYVTFNRETGSMNLATGVFDLAFKQKLALESYALAKQDPSRFQDPEYWGDTLAFNLSQYLKGVGLTGFDQDGNLYTANSAKYEITKWDKTFTTKRQVFKNDRKLAPWADGEALSMVEMFAGQVRAHPIIGKLITENVLKKAVAKAEMPPAKNPVLGIIPAPNGQLWIVRNIQLTTRETIIDVFSADGSFIGEKSLGDFAFAVMSQNGYYTRTSFRDKYMYAMTSNDDGDNTVVRYKY